MKRSLNRVELIGNLTKDPESNQTPQGATLCRFIVATNREWVTGDGKTHEDTEFSRVIAWDKLAEICGKLLVKGIKVYVEGRLSTRKFTSQDGTEKTLTEIIANDILVLSDRKKEEAPVSEG